MYFSIIVLSLLCVLYFSGNRNVTIICACSELVCDRHFLLQWKMSKLIGYMVYYETLALCTVFFLSFADVI